MTFLSKEQDLSNTIKKHSNFGNNYHIEYMDGSICNYYSSMPTESNKIKQQMIDQAIERDKNINLPKMQTLKNIHLLTAVYSYMCASVLIDNNSQFFGFLLVLFMLINIQEGIKKAYKIRELKKYRKFLEMYKDIELVNDSEFLKCIEPENIYQKAFDIETIDSFTYGEVKTMYKKYTKIKNNS